MIEIRKITDRITYTLFQLFRVSFCFLKTENVRGFVDHPVKTALFHIGAETVDVPRDYAHGDSMRESRKKGKVKKLPPLFCFMLKNVTITVC
jgi:hypothetical protein